MQIECQSNDLQLVGFGIFIGWVMKSIYQAFNGDPFTNYKSFEDLSQNVETLKLYGVGLLVLLFIIIAMESFKWYRQFNADSKQVEINEHAKDLSTALSHISDVLKIVEANRDKLKPTKQNIAYVEDINSESENEDW